MSELAFARRAARIDWGPLWVAPPLLVLALSFLYPLALIARAALLDESGAIAGGAALSVLKSRAFLNALLNTGEIALVSTAGCVALGLTLALILAFVPFPGPRSRRGSSIRSSPCRPSW